MENKISFRKKLSRVGTSFGFVIEEPLLNMIGLDFKNLKEDFNEQNIILRITIEKVKEENETVNVDTLTENVETLLGLIEETTGETKDETTIETKQE